MVPGNVDIPDDGVVLMEQQVFHLPVKIDEQVRKQLKTIRLWTSTNRGKTWAVTYKTPPTQTYFTVRAPRDGLYWFNVQTVSKDGREVPADITKEPPGLRVLVKRESVLCRIAMAPDGQTIATSGEDSRGVSSTGTPSPRSASLDERFDILLRVGPTGRVRRLSGHTAEILHLEFSPDRRFLASAGRDGTVRLSDVKTGRQLLEGKHRGAVAGLAYSPDGDKLASTGFVDGTVKLWQIPGSASPTQYGVAVWEDCARFVHPKSATLASPLFSDDGKHVLIPAQRSPALSRWNFATGKHEVMITEDHWKPAAAALLALSSGERTLISVELDQGADRRGEIRWHGLGTTPFWQLHFPRAGECILAVAVSPDGRCLAITGDNGMVSVWELATGRQRRKWDGIENGLVRALAFSRDCRRLAGSASDQLVSVWDIWPTPQRRGLEACWTDLAGNDAHAAFQAIADLAGMSDTIAFLRKKLRRIPSVSKEQIVGWVQDLDAAEYRVRAAAERELKRLGVLARPTLQQAIAGKTTLEARLRLRRLLENADSLPGFQLQVLRAVEALEQAASPPGIDLLQELAHSAAGDLAASEARNALRRIGNRTRQIAKPGDGDA